MILSFFSYGNQQNHPSYIHFKAPFPILNVLRQNTNWFMLMLNTDVKQAQIISKQFADRNKQCGII